MSYSLQKMIFVFLSLARMTRNMPQYAMELEQETGQDDIIIVHPSDL